jgi:hypothetical protein
MRSTFWIEVGEDHYEDLAELWEYLKGEGLFVGVRELSSSNRSTTYLLETDNTDKLRKTLAERYKFGVNSVLQAVYNWGHFINGAFLGQKAPKRRPKKPRNKFYQRRR